MTEDKLKEVLLSLWDNDETVPAPISHRCRELDWFSEGIKDNIIAYIAAKTLGVAWTEENFGTIDMYEVGEPGGG